MKEASEKVKFRLKTGKGCVQEFADASGVVYRPGEVVDLPSTYEGEAWLERVDPVPAVAAVSGRLSLLKPLSRSL